MNRISAGASMNWAAVGRGTLWAVAVTLVLGLSGAWVGYAFVWKETWLNVLAAVLLCLGAAAGGWYASRSAGQKGLYHGLGSGLLLLLLLLLLTAILPVSVDAVELGKKTLFVVVFASLGGILGVK
ncbi:MAG: hypothetical protein PWQ31_1783 [Eubacteriales bacterium]|nr:hypothetical protein [Eubacteriales bacterium]